MKDPKEMKDDIVSIMLSRFKEAVPNMNTHELEHLKEEFSKKKGVTFEGRINIITEELRKRKLNQI
jgi:hypothetical protein